MKKYLKLKDGSRSVYIDADTGEIIEPSEGGLFIPYSELLKHSKLPKHMRIRNSSDGSSSPTSLGSFTNFVYQRNRPIFSEVEKFKPAYISYLAYLSTYMTYKNNIILKSPKSIYESLNIAKSTFSVFLSTMIKNGIILKEDDCLFLNQIFFFRGRVSGSLTATRLYHEGVRNLYRSNRDILTVSKIFLLIPYVNFEYNIVCSNKAEVELENIKPLSPMQISEKIKGIGKGNYIYPILDKMMKLKVGDEYALAKCPVTGGIIVNPRIFYSGSKESYLNYLQGIFSIKSAASSDNREIIREEDAVNA